MDAYRCRSVMFCLVLIAAAPAAAQQGTAEIRGRVTDQQGQTAATVRTWFKNITGVECADRSRLMANMFFNRGRLYMIQGINLPSADDDSSSPAALRFANSISFFAADGTRNFADTFR